MSARTLSEIEASIEQMDLADQVRLLQYLTPKIAVAVLESHRGTGVRDLNAAWQRFQALGNRLAATSQPGAASLTEAVSQMRR